MPNFAAALSLLVGFLSLSQEILWVRLVSFALQGSGYAFALVLLFFLLGIAQGAAVGKRWCESGGDLLQHAARALLASAAVDAGIVWLLMVLGDTPLALPLMLGGVLASAALKATVFPIAHHLGSDASGPRLGRSVSRVYFANIVGCTLGPIVTGYVLLDLLPLHLCLAGVALATAALGATCARRSAARRELRWSLAPAVLAAACAVLPGHALVRALTGEPDVATVLENRHGIIHTVGQPGRPATVFGGNGYDGVISVDMATNPNDLDRALVLLTVHPQPERVLVIGMSAGAWTRILTASPQIRELVVIDINPAYVELVRQSPATAPLLRDPRVRVVIDDGRRWLRQHPYEQFDLIVQNTTFHWRAYSNNLLSREHLALCRAHLRPGGILALNSTFSADVLKTAQSVFAHVERRKNFIYGSDQAFAQTQPDARERLQALQLDGQPVFASAAFMHPGLAAHMLAEPFVPAERRAEGLKFRPAVITDNNLLAEQAHGNPFVYEQLDGLAAVMDRWRDLTAPAAPASP